MKALILSCTFLFYGSLGLAGQSSGFKEVPDYNKAPLIEWQELEISPAEFRNLLRQTMRGYQTIVVGNRIYRVQESSITKEYVSAIDDQSYRSGVLILPNRD